VSGAPVVAEDRQLAEGCAELGVDLTAAQRETLLRYLDLIYIWNRAAGLTTIPRERAVRLHLLDSLAAAPAVAEGPCVDLGTGAGLPGMVLAIARPETSYVLVESNRKRCSFLLEAIRILPVANARLIESDVESLPEGVLYPTVISRAFRPPAEFLGIARRLVKPAGHIVLLLADPSPSDLAELERAIGVPVEQCRRLRLPGGGEPRAIVCFRPA
jgi:16S rRNA (guanine527-N7)-methyltransferase